MFPIKGFLHMKVWAFCWCISKCSFVSSV